jgi:two-component system, cell cycle sensor histidine kinase and response regulator CckA
VLLPLAEADAPRADPVSPGPTRSGARLVLVVDDEDGVRAVARAALEYGGFEVLEARDGLEGVELVRAHGEAIALVLMDLTMPRMGGAEARRALLALRPELPVLLMSGFAHARAEAGAAPADFLPKPYTVDQLLHAVGARLGPLPR